MKRDDETDEILTENKLSVAISGSFVTVIDSDSLRRT